MTNIETVSDVDWMVCELIGAACGARNANVAGPYREQLRYRRQHRGNSRGLPNSFHRADSTADRLCPRPMRATQTVKVLLDENLDHRLRKHLGSYEVFTASFQGWNGMNRI